MIDNLPPEIGLPLAAVAWVGYLVTLAVQNSREKQRARLIPETHDSETGENR